MSKRHTILKFMMLSLMMIITKNNNFMISITLLIISFNLTPQTQMNTKISYLFSSDLISFWITNMSIMVFYTLVLLNPKNSEKYKKLMMIMMMTLIATFNNWSFMTFYMLFEILMIIILITIILWGYQPERTEAMMFMITMTLMFSLPFMMSMMKTKSTLNFWFMDINMHLMTFISFMFIFMMKMPIYFTHFWLPKAHVEAPIHGSMILAAILLKLGCYGMMRMNNVILKFKKLKPAIISMSILSMIVLSMNCLMQIDLKTTIAYSSIVHMAMVFMNITMLKSKSIFSSMLIILGHGLCAATLFFMANMMYENSKSRSMILNKGILTILPTMTLMWFITCMNNAPMPPSMNMMGELLSFKNLLSWSKTLYIPIILTAFTSSMYSIYLFCPPSHGTFSKMMNKIKMNTTNNMIIITMMMVPLNMMTIKPAVMMI